MGCQQKWQGEYVYFAFIANNTKALHQIGDILENMLFFIGYVFVAFAFLS